MATTKKPVAKKAGAKTVSRGVAKKDLLAMACCPGGMGSAKK